MSTIEAMPRPRRRKDEPGRTVRAANVRAHNREVVLRLVWGEREISRAEVARRTGLSRSTVSNIIDELFGTGLLRDAGAGQSIGGKPPKMMAFHDDIYGIVGVDLGATHLGVALTNLRGRMVQHRQVDHDVRNDPKGTITKLLELIREVVQARPRGMSRVIGIGVAVPAPIDPSHPNTFSPRVLPKWRDVRLAEVLEAEFQVPVLADNDANLGALAEHWWGAGRDGHDLAYLKVATGIGCGLVLGGSIYRGARFLAGEIGHVSVDPNGPICSCGQRGCLVTFVGTPAVLAQAASKGSVYLDFPALVAGADDGDEAAAEVIAEAANHLSIAIWNLVNVVNPATVVIGGTLSLAKDRLSIPISSALLSRHNWTSDAQTRIVVSELGDPGIAVGAATAVLQRALAQPEMFEAKLVA